MADDNWTTTMMKMKLSIYSYITWRILYYQVPSSSHDPKNFLASPLSINRRVYLDLC
jgi:hypothetical protein